MLEQSTEPDVRLCPPCTLGTLYDYDSSEFRRDTEYLCPSCEILWRPAPELAAAHRAEHPLSSRRAALVSQPRIAWAGVALGTCVLHLAAFNLLGTFPLGLGVLALMLLTLATGTAGVVVAVRQVVLLAGSRMRIRRLVRRRTITSESLHRLLHTR